MKYTHLIAAFLLVMISIPVTAQEAYSPDRPGIGNGSFITPNQMLGLEAGIQFSTTPFIKQIDIGQLLLRYGIADRVELRAALNSYTSQEVTLTGGTATNSGFQDIGIGAKLNLLEQSATKPNLSLLGSLSLPAGSDEFTSNETVPSLVLLADYPLTSTFGISSNLGYSFEAGAVDDAWLFTLTPGFVISSENNISGYFGYAGLYHGSFNETFIESGVTLTLTSGVQLDLNTGYETESEYFFLGAGVARGF